MAINLICNGLRIATVVSGGIAMAAGGVKILILKELMKRKEETEVVDGEVVTE